MNIAAFRAIYAAANRAGNLSVVAKAEWSAQALLAYITAA